MHKIKTKCLLGNMKPGDTSKFTQGQKGVWLITCNQDMIIFGVFIVSNRHSDDLRRPSRFLEILEETVQSTFPNYTSPGEVTSTEVNQKMVGFVEELMSLIGTYNTDLREKTLSIKRKFSTFDFMKGSEDLVNNGSRDGKKSLNLEEVEEEED